MPLGSFLLVDMFITGRYCVLSPRVKYMLLLMLLLIMLEPYYCELLFADYLSLGFGIPIF